MRSTAWGVLEILRFCEAHKFPGELVTVILDFADAFFQIPLNPGERPFAVILFTADAIMFSIALLKGLVVHRCSGAVWRPSFRGWVFLLCCLLGPASIAMWTILPSASLEMKRTPTGP